MGQVSLELATTRSRGHIMLNSGSSVSFDMITSATSSTLIESFRRLRSYTLYPKLDFALTFCTRFKVHKKHSSMTCFPNIILLNNNIIFEFLCTKKE